MILTTPPQYDDCGDLTKGLCMPHWTVPGECVRVPIHLGDASHLLPNFSLTVPQNQGWTTIMTQQRRHLSRPSLRTRTNIRAITVSPKMGQRNRIPVTLSQFSEPWCSHGKNLKGSENSDHDRPSMVWRKPFFQVNLHEFSMKLVSLYLKQRLISWLFGQKFIPG